MEEDRAGPFICVLPTRTCRPRLSFSVLVAERSASSSRVRRPPPRMPLARRTQLAEWIAAAERAVIITLHACKETSRPGACQTSPSACAIPVVVHNTRRVACRTAITMHFGYEPGAWLADEDLVIAIVPTLHGIFRACKARRPPRYSETSARIRSSCANTMSHLPSDLAIQAAPPNTLQALNAPRRSSSVYRWRRRESPDPPQHAPDRAQCPYTDAAHTDQGLHAGTRFSPGIFVTLHRRSVGRRPP